jgi:hypothetical protein
MVDDPYAGRAYRRWWEVRDGFVCTMKPITTDQFTGTRYRCSCGWAGWTVWGAARKHSEACEQAWAPRGNA